MRGLRGLLMVQAIVTRNENAQAARFEKCPEMLEYFDTARAYIDSQDKPRILDDETLRLLRRAEEFHRNRSASLAVAQASDIVAEF